MDILIQQETTLGTGCATLPRRPNWESWKGRFLFNFHSEVFLRYFTWYGSRLKSEGSRVVPHGTIAGQKEGQTIAMAKQSKVETRKTKAAAPKPPSKKAEQSPSLVTQAYEEIKERILMLHFLPGQYLNEAAICSNLNLGRTPVHLALQRLQVEGLVEILPRKGIVVQPDSFAQIIKILDSRLTVEPELARGAARRAKQGVDASILDRLKSLATATDPKQNPPDIAAFTVNDRRFHQEVASLAGNIEMSEFARRLHERSTRFWYLNLWQTIDVKTSNRQHAAIAQAIIAGDEDAAAQHMREHIQAVRDRLEKIQHNSPNALRRPSDHFGPLGTPVQ
ncbi:GntR family transcriptional regulator [Bradyrhizobium manausense]